LLLWPTRRSWYKSASGQKRALQVFPNELFQNAPFPLWLSLFFPEMQFSQAELGPEPNPRMTKTARARPRKLFWQYNSLKIVPQISWKIQSGLCWLGKAHGRKTGSETWFCEMSIVCEKLEAPKKIVQMSIHSIFL